MLGGARIVGNHIYFFRGGDSFTVPEAGTCAREEKPGITDTGWVDLGVVNEMEIEPSAEERLIYKPSPGQYRLWDLKETKRSLTVRFTAEELSPIIMEMLFLTEALTTTSDQYNPLEGSAKVGWLHVEQYDDTDTQLNTFETWSHLRINGAMPFNDQIASAKIEARLLHSTLNTGTLVATVPEGN